MLGQRRAQSLRSAVILASVLWSLACGKPADDTKTSQPEPHAVSSSSPPPLTPPLRLHPAFRRRSQPPLPPPILRATATPIEANRAPVPLPKPDDVRDAMARVFDKAVALDEHQLPGFFVGDFNGDGSEDLAV